MYPSWVQSNVMKGGGGGGGGAAASQIVGQTRPVRQYLLHSRAIYIGL
jgi:hypothetical protein